MHMSFAAAGAFRPAATVPGQRPRLAAPAAQNLGDTVRLIRLPGVCEPHEDTALLLGAMSAMSLAGARVLDLGSGTGVLALRAAKMGAADVVALDISWRAIWSGQLNSLRRRASIKFVRADLAQAAKMGKFDAVITNPPYVPSPPSRRLTRRWTVHEAGPTGRAVLDRICQILPSLLKPDACALIVHDELCGINRTLRALREGGLGAEVVSRTPATFGPRMRARAPWLESVGLLQPGQRETDVVVIRADQRGG